MSQIVEREHRRDSGVDRGESGRGVPVVQVYDISSALLDERCDGARESEESLGVTRICNPTGGDGSTTPSDSRHLDQMDAPGDRMLTDTDRTRPRPVRQRERDPLLTNEFHTPVVGQKNIDLYPGATKRADQPTRGGGKAADGGERRQLGGGEGDAHPHIVVDGRPERT